MEGRLKIFLKKTLAFCESLSYILFYKSSPQPRKPRMSLLHHTKFGRDTGIEYVGCLKNGHTGIINIPTISERDIVKNMIPCVYGFKYLNGPISYNLIFCNSREDFATIVSDWNYRKVVEEYILIEKEIEYELDYRGNISWRFKE